MRSCIAPMASGNSGGPLVDACGRVVGINSFGSLSDGNDAEFGFAISNREIASFLRQAGVAFARTNAECKSPEQAQEEEARRTEDRNSVVTGKSGSVRVDLVGCRFFNKKNTNNN